MTLYAAGWREERKLFNLCLLRDLDALLDVYRITLEYDDFVPEKDCRRIAMLGIWMIELRRDLGLRRIDTQYRLTVRFE